MIKLRLDFDDEMDKSVDEIKWVLASSRLIRLARFVDEIGWSIEEVKRSNEFKIFRRCPIKK
jgi:hypothetical protein